MIPWILESVLGNGSVPDSLRVGEYISVRSSAALITAFLVSILAGNQVIAFLARMRFGQPVRDSQGENAISLAEMHGSKQGTPTMGGLLMIGSLLCAAGLFCDWREPVLLLAVAVAVGFGAIGFIDDYLKVCRKNSDGLSARAKLGLQAALATLFALVCFSLEPVTFSYEHGALRGADILVLPFLKNAAFAAGILWIPFAIVVLTGTSNAVNLTDGLDGLATGVTISATLCFAVVAYLAGRVDLSSYLFIPNVRGAGELTVLLSALIGSSLGFLWFNGYPARVFMGDTGSMMIGGLLGAVALLLKQEFLLLIVGGVFVAESLSVIIQVLSYKWRQKRVFLMSPLHHHFERAGVPESHIIVRFWIVSVLLALAGLSTLKLR